MFYYVKARKKGTPNSRAMREEGKILVFSKPESAKEHADKMTDFKCMVVPLSRHPAHKQSPLYGKRYAKAGW